MIDIVQATQLIAAGAPGIVQTLVLVGLCVWVWRADRVLIRLADRIEALERTRHIGHE